MFVVSLAGLLWLPMQFILACLGLSLIGAKVAPGILINCIHYWMFACLPGIIAFAYLGLWGTYGWGALAMYWLVTAALRRWESNLKVGEKAPLRTSYLRPLAAYFPSRLHVDCECKEGLQLIVSHPHGLWGAGTWTNLIHERAGSSLPHRRRICTLDINFYVPIVRDYLFACGLISSSATSIRRCLRAGISVVLVVGGGREAMLARPGTMDLVLDSRRGFVKLALESGASLVPAITFGETALYKPARENALWESMQRQVHRKFKFSLPNFAGLHGTWLAHPTPLNTVLGSPVLTRKTENPSDDMIEEVHKQYCARVQALYDKYKDEFDVNRKLEMRIVA